MAKDIGGFGKPKELPGKPGFKKKESDKLEDETAVMESRLKQLRMTMMEEKKKREEQLPLKHGGNRWRSAREDRGSVTTYAKDLQEKISRPKSKEGTNTTGTSKKKKLIKEEPTSGINSSRRAPLSTGTVASWTPIQVVEWLYSIGLEELHSAFEFHQVTGSILVGLQPEELVQLGVTKLSYRNLILNEIEKLRKAIRQEGKEEDNNSSDRNGRPLPPAPVEIIDSKIRDVENNINASEGVHWSHAKPLSENAITGNGEVPVNLADGEFDEDAGHASFMKALLEWRAADDSATAGYETKKQEGLAVVNGDDGMWTNPMFELTNDTEADGSSLIGSGGALLDGEYDEAKAQLEFMQAVQAWRNGGLHEEGFTSAKPTSQAKQQGVVHVEQTGTTTGTRQSCWQCYKLCSSEEVIVDSEKSKKSFCCVACLEIFSNEYARFYTK
jgi:hypothetical protein